MGGSFLKQLKFFVTIFILMTMIFSVAEAANKPVRVARLPILFNHRQPDKEALAFLETKISRAVIIPLNGTLKLANYLEPEKSAFELNNIWQKMRAQNRKLKLAETIRPLADKLNADIVICPILLHYSEFSIQAGPNFETRHVSNVSAELIVYDRRTDEFIDKKTSRSYNDSASPYGKASYLAADCFDRLITETKLKRKFMAIK